MAASSAQTPYPELTVQDVTWMEGTHHYAVTNTILSPATASLPTEIGASADVEFVSATEVHLLPGFHAGGFNSQGQFHARIDQGLGDPADLVIISPAPDGSSPYGSIEDNVVHVHKWEKVEVGLRLPQAYQEAIDQFFEHYYPYNYPPYLPDNSLTNVATPGSIDAIHDLNPYADDSLQLVMTLTRPDGTRTMKWGFYMRETTWDAVTENAELTEDPSNPLHPHHIRFRFAPDMEGEWRFDLSVKAPYTQTSTGNLLADLTLTGLSLVCEAALPDNNGHLEVNALNQRTLQFAGAPIAGDETPFFGLGVNLGARRNDGIQGFNPYKFYRKDLLRLTETFSLLHDVGGNFVRMYLMPNSFAPEWVNLGVYDAFRTPQVCDVNALPGCLNGGWTTDVTGNCQYQCWAFDQIVDQARASNIYIQLCIDPYPPVVDYEKFIWGAHPYLLNYLEPKRENPPDPNPLDLKRFFFSFQGDEDPDDPIAVRLLDEGVFYYWKRRYKYVMSRWGWSVNIPIIEPFNEIDQMLSYSNKDMTPDPNIPCQQWGDEPDWATCLENRVNWTADPKLPGTVSDWFTNMAEYVRGQQTEDPVHSPLGEDKKLFLASYAGGHPDWSTYHSTFSNDNVDLIDAHRAPQNPWDLRAWNAQAELYRTNFTNDGLKKPFHHGEFTSYGDYRFPEQPPHTYEYNGTYTLFDNYDVSFHNELWSSTFSGSFAAGTTWGWERVFWWPDALPVPPPDGGNPNGPNHLTSLGAINKLYLGDAPNGLPFYAEVENRTLQHHYKPLSDFLGKPSVQELGLFTEHFTPHVVESNGIECFYLINDAQDVAVGWVHNASAYWRNALYIKYGFQHYMDCAAPPSQTIMLTGFATNTNFKVSYHPTRATMTDLPVDQVDLNANPFGVITLNLNTAPLNGVFPLSLTGNFKNHLDTLHSDYAFIIATDLIKRLDSPTDADEAGVEAIWDFSLFPNPTRNRFTIGFMDSTPKSIELLDISGRTVRSWSRVTSARPEFSIDGLAHGAYWVRATDGTNQKTKKLLIH
jgi:hypothetical protein